MHVADQVSDVMEIYKLHGFVIIKEEIPQFHCQLKRPTALISHQQINHATCDPVHLLKHTQDLQDANDDDDDVDMDEKEEISLLFREEKEVILVY